MKERIKKILKELEQTRNEFWNITPETGAFLNSLIKIKNFKTLMEVGTSNGYSAIWLAEALFHTGGHLCTLESHKERFQLAQQNINQAQLSPQVTQIKGHAPEAIPKTPRKFDLAFFDATKFEHPEYFHILAPRIKKRGLIITDNAISHKKELAPYIKLVNSRKEFRSILLPLGTGLLISEKF